MSFRCNTCSRTIRTASDVLDCARCKSNGTASRIPPNTSGSDDLTPFLMGALVGAALFSSSESSASTYEPAETFSGGGGESGGGGSSYSYDSGGSSDSGSSVGGD